MRKNLVISTYDSIGNPYYSGGGAQSIHEVSKRLNQDYKVTVIAGNYPKAKEKFTDGVHYRYMGTKLFGPKVGQIIYHLCLPLAVLTNKHDLWIENFTPPISTSFLPLFTKKPVVGLVHMLSGEDMRRKFGFPFDIIEKFGLKLYKHFIVLSKNNQERIKLTNPNANFLITKNGVDIPKKLLPYQKRNKKHILFLGRIEINQKGLDTLISAYSQLNETVSIPLVIAGGGEKSEIENLKNIIRDHGLQDKVKLVGRVSGQKKDWYLKHASLVVIPSRYETFSVTALEAISYNIPLICSDVDGMKWILNNNAIKFPSGSVEGLLRSLSKLLEDTKLQEEMTKLQSSTANQFNWDLIVGSYKKFLNNLQK